MNKISKVLMLVICLLLSIPSIGFAALLETNKQKVRHKVQFYIDPNLSKMTVRTTKISFDTGLKKVNEYDYYDESYLPKLSNGSKVQYEDYATVVDTPLGLKAYIIISQNHSLRSEGYLQIIYEFDYTTLKVRKINETKSIDSHRVHLDASLGIYSIRPDNGDYQHYSLIDNKLMYSKGQFITPYDVTETNYTFTPLPQSKDLAAYCSNNDVNECHFISFGGAKGAKVKVTYNQVVRDINNNTSKTFFARSAKIKLESKFINRNTSQWTVTGVKNKDARILFKGKATEVITYISPGNKYLVLIAETHEGPFTVLSSVVHIFDLDTLSLVQKYDSQYRARADRITWASDDVFIIEYYLSNPGGYPPSFYYIPHGMTIPVNYNEYTDWVNRWDSFSYEDMFMLTCPVAIISGKSALKYKDQPTFKLNGAYYVPLQDFTEAFNIKYSMEADRLTFTRNKRNVSLSLKTSGIIQHGDRSFIPLGNWNKDLGLKVLIIDSHVMNGELTFMDQEEKNGFGMNQGTPSQTVKVQSLQRQSSTSPFIEGEYSRHESNEPNRASFNNAVVELNHNKTLTVEGSNSPFAGKTMTIEIYTRDLKTLIMKIPVKLGTEQHFQFTTPAIPVDESVTIVMPDEDNTYYTFTLYHTPFDKEIF